MRIEPEARAGRFLENRAVERIAVWFRMLNEARCMRQTQGWRKIGRPRQFVAQPGQLHSHLRRHSGAADVAIIENGPFHDRACGKRA
jgi:hypothetical protein